MFISKKRWKQMERRVADLEKKSTPKTVSLFDITEAFKTALTNACSRFEYELTENPKADSAVARFSTSPKSNH